MSSSGATGQARSYSSVLALVATLGAGAIGACVGNVTVIEGNPQDAGAGAAPGTATVTATATATATGTATATSTTTGGGPDAGACLPPMVHCGSACVDLESNPAHCGACDVACAPGQTCVTGSCAAETCVTECPGDCTNLMTSEQSCGACGNACAAGAICAAGACVPCPGGATACRDGCFDLSTDPLSCGFCGRSCGAGQICVNGACAGACPDDAYEDNDSQGAAAPIAWGSTSPTSAWAAHSALLCNGDQDWLLLPTAMLGLFNPVMSIETSVKGATGGECFCDCLSGMCPHDYLEPGPHHTVTVEVYNAATMTLLATATNNAGFFELGAYGPELNQDVLLRVSGPPEAQYPYVLHISIWENNGEEAECEC